MTVKKASARQMTLNSEIKGVMTSMPLKSDAFAGKSRIQQHRMVYDAFGEGELGGAVHALQIKTEVP